MSRDILEQAPGLFRTPNPARLHAGSSESPNRTAELTELLGHTDVPAGACVRADEPTMGGVAATVVVILMTIGLLVTTIVSVPAPATARVRQTHPVPTRSVSEAAALESVQVTAWQGEDGFLCSGTAIAGTRFIVTAAHCLEGERVTEMELSWHGQALTPRRWVHDTRYHDIGGDTRYDLGLIEVAETLDGPDTARIWDGERLVGPRVMRAWNYEGPTPTEVGCEAGERDTLVATQFIEVPCSFRPGASGSGMIRLDAAGEPVLVGVLSSYVEDPDANFYAPTWGLARLEGVLATQPVQL